MEYFQPPVLILPLSNTQKMAGEKVHEPRLRRRQNLQSRTEIHAKFDDRAGGAHAWKLRRDLLSKHYTTSWDELPEIVHKGAVSQR